jgi:hypothetical protein
VADDAVGEVDRVSQVRCESASVRGDGGGDGFGRGEEGHDVMVRLQFVVLLRLQIAP